MSWYSKYLTVYEKSFLEVPEKIVLEAKDNLNKKQSTHPLASVVVIAYNEEKRLLSCLWSLSESICKYPIEIIGVNNNSSDKSEEVFLKLGLPYFNESNKGPGFARNCGLQKAKGKYYICIDGDTIYPPKYLEILINELEKPNVVAVSSLWSYIPDKKHSMLLIKVYEFFRDIYLRIQFIQQPELVVRGMVFGHITEKAREINYRVDIKRGEDGSMALALKKYGKIIFINKYKARVLTGYGTLSLEGSVSKSIMKRFFKSINGFHTLFTKKTNYTDREENLIK